MMTDYQTADTEAMISTLETKPIHPPQSDKGRYFNLFWWPMHHKKIEGPVLRAISRTNDPAFDRRVNIMRIVERVDASAPKEESNLADLEFTPTEITRYVTRAINKRLRSLAGSDDACWVIRNQKLTRLALTHKSAE